MNSIKKPIVIVGSGFAGISAALNFKHKNPNNSIIVIDSKENFLFKPLMYEVLSNEIQPWEIDIDFQTIFSNTGITFLNKELKSISLANNLLKLKDGLQVEYSYLVLSTGSLYNSFSIKGVQEYCNFFHNMEDLTKLKNVLEKRSTKSGLNNNLFIIGGGPSGVELACKLSDLYNENFRITVIERSQEILNNNKIFNREEAFKAIQNRKINLLLNTTVKEISEKEIVIIDKFSQLKNLNYEAIIWTAGVKPCMPIVTEEIEKYNEYILIRETLQLKEFANVFAIGDIASIEGSEDLPKTAQLAMQQGIHVAENLNLLINKKDSLPFIFKDNGEMISLGIGEASISGLGLTLSGKFAFELRRLIYASKMPLFEKSFKSAASWIIDKKSLLNSITSKMKSDI